MTLTGTLTGTLAGRLRAGAATALLAATGLLLPAAAPEASAAAAAPYTSRFGAWAKTPEDVPRLAALMGHPLTSLRIYYDTPPTRWLTTGLLGALPDNGTVSISFHHGTPAQVQAFLSGHPATVKCYATYYHEPEFVFVTPAQQAEFQAAFATYAPAIRAAGCIPTLILHNWVMHDPTRNWRDWYPQGSVDALGFDAYNLTAPKGVYPTPAEFLAPFVAASRETGLPWAMPEVGSFISPGGLTSASRAEWAHGVAVAARRDPGFLFANWWDSIGADTSKDFTMDTALGAAWRR